MLSVRGVVEHLANNLAPNLAVVPALHLDERRYGVLVNEQVIKRPPVSAVRRFYVLAGDEYPSAGNTGANLLTVQ